MQNNFHGKNSFPSHFSLGSKPLKIVNSTIQCFSGLRLQINLFFALQVQNREEAVTPRKLPQKESSLCVWLQLPFVQIHQKAEFWNINMEIHIVNITTHDLSASLKIISFLTLSSVTESATCFLFIDLCYLTKWLTSICSECLKNSAETEILHLQTSLL